MAVHVLASLLAGFGEWLWPIEFLGKGSEMAGIYRYHAYVGVG